MLGDCALNFPPPPPKFTFSLSLVRLLSTSWANERVHWFEFILQNKWCDNTEKRGTCGFSQDEGHIISCKLKLSYFCSWLEANILFSPLSIGRRARKIMRRRSSGLKAKLRVQTFVYWTNYFIHQKELCETQTGTVSLSNPTFYSWWHEYEMKNPFIDLLNW